MSNDAISQQLADARRALARIERSQAKYVALVERLQCELHGARDVASPKVVCATDDHTRWLREWVHVGTGDVPSPWDELEWADVRTPSSEVPTLGSACSVAMPNESGDTRVVGYVMGIQYHRQLAMIRTANGENYAGPLSRLQRARECVDIM